MKYISKTITATHYVGKFYDNNTDSMVNLEFTMAGKFNETAHKKFVKGNDQYTALKIVSHEAIEDTRRIPADTFMEYAHKVTPDNPKKPDDVTRTISTYISTVKVYDNNTDEIRLETYPVKVDNPKQIKSDIVTALKVVSVKETQTLYAMPLETFMKYSESFER